MAGPSGAMDFAYLESFMAGDRQVIAEVLNLFLDQARGWSAGLDAGNPGWRDLVHTIKGSARGIGATALGDICARVEADGEAYLTEVQAALSGAVSDIAAYLARG